MTSNKPPIAVAGPDQMISLPTDSVLLDGSASKDADGKITMWRWTKIAGPASSNINHTDAATTAVRKLMKGIYQFELTVTDDVGATAKDTIQIAVNVNSNHTTLACAGPDQTITLPVNSVILDGSCTLANNSIQSYLWTKISGPSTFSIANQNGVKTQVTNLVEGTFLFQLKVTDDNGLFTLDTVQVMVSRQPENPNIDIYVSGHEHGKAKYWKNGKEVMLPSQSFESVATSIAVDGNDVYVSGEEGDLFITKHNKAKYWKNGQEVLLTGATGAGAASITVSGGDVYVAGHEISGNKMEVKYWKNGQPVILSNKSKYGDANCIAVVNGNVYVAGYEGEENHFVAKLWKNGQELLLAGDNHSMANSIAVQGDDIYVAGWEENGSAAVAKYWKNGQPVALTNGSEPALAYGIAISGNDVYVAGYEGEYYHTVAKYWKNGQAVALTNPDKYAYARGIAIYDGEVYVAGYDNGPQFVAQYWRNGQSVPLSGGTGAWATGILIVPH